jgi:hypothetical protein
MPIHFLMMKQKNSTTLYCCYILICCIIISCNSSHSTEKIYAGYGADAVNSVLIAADSLNTFPFVEERVNEIKAALKNPKPVLLCKDSLNNEQALAQIIALSDSVFIL